MEFEYTTWPLVIALSPVAELVFNMFPVDIGVTKIAVVEDWADVGFTLGCWCFSRLCGCLD